MSTSPARLLWDGGGLWSLMCLEAAQERGLALSPISAAQIARGGLDGVRLLVVPGGWSRRKQRALGPSGATAIKDFLRQGGMYLGFCGGAGLALSVDDGLGLVPLSRDSGAGRVAGLSGPVMVRPTRSATAHTLWQNTPSPTRWLVWFPGQFAEPADPSVQVIARYQEATPELCLAGPSQDLSPLWGQPAVIEAKLGQGRLLLSYVHLDTPGDAPGGEALERLWAAWLGSQAKSQARSRTKAPSPRLAALARSCAALWDQGRDLGLWQARHPAMPLWQRGARGLEFWELKRLSEALAAWGPDDPELAEEMETALEPLLAHGDKVLQAQAARLAGDEPEAGAAEIEATWFPRPRRTGGDWAVATQRMERLLANLIPKRY